MLQVFKAFSTVLAVTLVFAGSALAGPKDKYHGGAVDARQHGYEHGYREGLHKGLNDRGHHDKFKPEVKDDDAGYEKFMGPKDEYKAGYRSGFVAGYDDGFNNRPARFSEVYGTYEERVRGSADRYDDVYTERGFTVSDVAYDIGYRDGVVAGAADYGRHINASPEGQRDYRDADHGYRPSYGNRVVYQSRYRNAFVEGYRDGYRGVR